MPSGLWLYKVLIVSLCGPGASFLSSADSPASGLCSTVTCTTGEERERRRPRYQFGDRTKSRSGSYLCRFTTSSSARSGSD